MLNTWLDELRAKPRLRLGLLAVLALGWIFGLLELEAASGTARQEQTRLSHEIGRMKAISGQTQWRKQRDAVFMALADLRSRAWRDESEGRMQAQMQDWVRERLAAQGLQARELNVVVLPAGGQPPAGEDRSRAGVAAAPNAAGGSASGGGRGGAGGGGSGDSDLRLVRSRVVFEFQPDKLHELLAAVEASPKWLWVPRLVVHNGNRRSVELEIEALFILGTRGGA